MNPFIRPRPQAPEARVRALSALVEPLTARVRQEELRWIASYPQISDPQLEARLRGLAELGQHAVERRTLAITGAETLRRRVEAAGAGARAMMEAHLRAERQGAALKEDLAALDRDLDLPALLERFAARIEQHGARIEVILEVVGGMALLGDPALVVQTGALNLIIEAMEQDHRLPTRRTGARVLAGLLRRQQGGVPLTAGWEALERRVMDLEEDPWLRRAALDAFRRHPEGAMVVGMLARERQGREAFLVRAQAVRVAGAAEFSGALLRQVLTDTVDDPSETVRFARMEAVVAQLEEQRQGAEQGVELLAWAMSLESQPRARARALALVGELLGRRPELLEALDGVLCRHLLAEDEAELKVQGFALDAILAALQGGAWISQKMRRILEHIQQEGATIRHSASRRASLCLIVEGAAPGLVALLGRLDALPEGGQAVVQLPEGCGVEDLARALTPLAGSGFGFTLQRVSGRSRVRVTRGERQGIALWRVLHELRHPGPTKRQGHLHSTGRASDGAVRVPPGGLAEEAATGVPGQRVVQGDQLGWAPFLPMVDDLLDALRHPEIAVVSPEGVCRLRPPAGFGRRFWLWALLSWGYAGWDRLRLSVIKEEEPERRRRFIDRVRAAGFHVTFQGFGAAATFYSVWAEVAFLMTRQQGSLLHLAVIIVALLTLLGWKMRRARTEIQAARQRYGLVMGGWGTRGKSGTERLKAGMLEGFGVPFFSKTTGCEAMVLHAPPGGHAMELFLFRPYDKASIWEQRRVVAIGAALHARAFLWECMALNPRYVDLLQNSWMQDDLSTLTNAYPDHEDIQGPTGMDVARVIGSFAPTDALLLTTEENMLPVIRAEAGARNTHLIAINRAARELVPRDLMDRMPHAEHPSNVALASAVGVALGLDRTEAIGMMAEHVVPDLGALLIYPEARHMGRTVRFASGMSANDVLSFRHNWRHCGYAAHDRAATPGRWLVTVVNNRADRVARSRIFAGIVADDAAAHRHLFIGTNTNGLHQYTAEAVAERLRRWEPGPAPQADRLFAHLQPTDPAAMAAACAARLTCGADEPGLSAALAAWEAAARPLLDSPPPATWAAAQALAARLRDPAAALERACAGILAPQTTPGIAAADAAGLADAVTAEAARWFAWQGARARSADRAAVSGLYTGAALASIHILGDSGASGDQVIAAALALAPPGAEVWLMGVQNIKGTGLDFAYQWVGWREIHRRFEGLRSRDPVRRRAALDALDNTPVGSMMVAEEILRALTPLAQDIDLRERAAALAARVQGRHQTLAGIRQAGRVVSRWEAWAGWIEGLLEPFAAIWRRDEADQIFQDLCDQRISHPRAAERLRELTEQQKGGWLWKFIVQKTPPPRSSRSHPADQSHTAAAPPR